MLLHDLLDFQARARGGLCLAQCADARISYAEARARSRDIASALSSAGLRRGDRLGLLMQNSIEMLLFIFAASRLGVAVTPLNFRLAPREWANLLTDAGARVVVADEEFCAQLDSVLGTAAPRRICHGARREGWDELEAFISQAPPFCAPDDLSPDEVLLQIYTSGTTGKPKGALLTHRNVIANMVQGTFAAAHKLDPGERALLVLPLFHVAGTGSALSVIAHGGCLVMHKTVDPGAIARALADDEIVVTTLVPSVIQFLLVGVPGLAEMRFPSLKLITYGAAPIAESVLRRAMDVFGCDFSQAYGMTELAGGATLLTEVDHRRALSGRPDLLLSAGKAMPGTEVRVVGPDDIDLAPGQVGEIVVRGAQMMAGYWNAPAATAEALRGGWMHTGDAGCLDEEGYLYVRDRIKDMIVSGGENIYPAEIEAVLYSHPHVAEVSVIGVPDDRWGEAVMAVIVRRVASEPTEQDLIAFCRERLGGFKVPRRYAFVDALPRNPAGKVLKRELRQPYWEGLSRQVG